MEILKGIGVSPGYAIGEAVIFEREEALIQGRFVPPEEVDAEVERFERAVNTVKGNVERIRNEVRDDLGEGVSAIFESHRWVLDDAAFREGVFKRIRNNRFTAEYAVDRAFKRFIRRLRALPDVHFSQRAQDLEDLEKQIISALAGSRACALAELSRPMVIVSRDLPPSQLACLDKKMVLGIATDFGGRTSHTAILARDYGIPAVVGLETCTVDVAIGDTVIVDGSRGLLVVAPDDKTLERYRAIEAEFVDFEQKLHERSRERVATSDGVSVSVFANIEFPEELDSVVESGADGVGLFRTEFLFLSANRVPSEEEHAEVYTKVAETLAGKPVVIRSFDLGADKLLSGEVQPRSGISTARVFTSVDGTKERNPALGLRGVRLYRAYPEVFRSQLAAIYRASAHGDVRLLVPMVSVVEEVRWVKEMCQETQRELRRREVPFNPEMPVGIMVETPAAAMAVDIFASEVDFVSIGTNDLIQYTLAVDRSNERVAPAFQPLNPSVLRLIRGIIEAGRDAGIGVAMCGEMAGEWALGVLLLGMGLRLFSVPPGAVPEMKSLLPGVSVAEAEEAANEVLRMRDPLDAMAYLERVNRRLFPELFRHAVGRGRL